MDETTRNEFLGRAYFHRAYRYMNLCFQFGDVPFVSKIIESPKQDYKSTKREAIIKRMVQDMEASICQECYEVSEDVIEEFEKVFEKKYRNRLFYRKENGKYQLNLGLQQQSRNPT